MRVSFALQTWYASLTDTYYLYVCLYYYYYKDEDFFWLVILMSSRLTVYIMLPTIPLLFEQVFL